MNKIAVLKRLSVFACVLALPLWFANYGVTVFGDMYVPFAFGSLGIWLGVFGAPVILLLLILGGISKKPKITVALCSLGLVLFVLNFALVCNTAYNVNQSHIRLYPGLRADSLNSAEVWLGEDEQGADIWQELSAEETAGLLQVLERVDIYKEWHGENNIETFSQIPTEHPEWHFRLCYADGRAERLFVGSRYYLIDREDGLGPQVYQSRPYDMWDGDCWNSDVLAAYQDYMLRYEL